tara:strand:- start:525232 stop:526035 length:804 start_codon:yes stop_codon:yes gene_type:complete
MRRWIIRITLAMGIVAGVATFASWWAIRQTRQVPEFYSQAEKRIPVKTLEASRRLNADVVRLKDDAARIGSWHAVFSDARLNAWLVEEFPKQFPKLFARGASDPRVVIEDDRILVAARYKDHRFDTVVSCEVTAELTEEPNLIAVRVKNLRAGALRLPLNAFLKGITREAANGDVDVQWDFTDSGPVALVTIPSEHPDYVCGPVIVESLQLRNGRASLAGHTGELAHQVFEPAGPIYQFVSYRQPDNRNRHDPSDGSSRSRSISNLR